MPLSYKVLDKLGTTPGRLRSLLTARGPKPGDPPADTSKPASEDLRLRTKLEDFLKSRIQEAVANTFERHTLYSAVDLAWDSSPINGSWVPLMLYAQGRIKPDTCAKILGDIGCESQYVKKDAGGHVTAVERPRFVMVDVNLVRSVITRRVAAQMNRFNNLWPFFKYEARSTRPEEKLRADAVSQIADITADQFGYKDIQEQVVRDIMLYQHVTIFPTCQWQRDVQLTEEELAAEMGGVDPKFKSKIVREGPPFTIAHPSRTFFDTAHPARTINTDTGCEWFGYWDVCRWGEIKNNPAFFNTDATGFNGVPSQFSTTTANPYLLQYFSQYATALAPVQPSDDYATENDAKSKVGQASALADDAPVLLTHFMWKLTPVEWGIGKYPHPVWIHFTVAGDLGTVIHAEIMPDTPGVHFAFNGSDNRRHNLSIAHDLFGHQDAMNNLHNQLLEEVRRDLLTVFMLNTEVWDGNDELKKARDQFISHLTGSKFFEEPLLLQGQFSKLKELLGKDAFDPKSIFNVIRTQPNTNIDAIMKAMAQTMQMAERMVSLSPQEQGQMSPRETSATEVQVVATTTENVYSFISDAIDAGRAAWKRYIYNAWVSLGSDDVSVPVADRYPAGVIEAAGFNRPALTDGGATTFSEIVGKRSGLVCELIFNSRDGAERSSNIQAANSLTQLLQVILGTPASAELTKEKFFEIINEIARLGGSGVDLKLQADVGTSQQPLVPGSTSGSPPALAPTAPSTMVN